MELICSYFSSLTENQKNQFAQLKELYEHWNAQINVISRKDMDQFYLHHVLHSLSLVRYANFSPGTKIMDLGTGGGFPGIPLAIYYPEVEFVLIDSIGKKIKVVNEVISALHLTNVKTYHSRAEERKDKFHYVVTRAVAPLKDLVQWTRFSYEKKEINALPNGLIAYKGGDLKDELDQIKKTDPYEIWTLSEIFKEDYFNQKYLIYVQK